MDVRRTTWTLTLLLATLAAGPSASEGSAAAQAKPAAQPAARPRAAELRERLAAIELSIRVDRKLEEAAKALDELREQAAGGEPYPQRVDVRAEIAIVRAKLFLELGLRDQAAAALADVEVAEPRVAEWLAELERPQRAAAAEPKRDPADPMRDLRGLGYVGADSGVDAAVARAFVPGGDWSIVKQIGTRATPALERLVAQDLEAFPAHRYVDPFNWLVRLAEKRAADFVLERYDQGGFFWKRRVLRVFEPQQTADDAEVLGHGAWRHAPDSKGSVPPATTQPEWIRVYERLLGDPAVWRDALTHLRKVATRDALTESIRSRLSEMLAGGDADLSAAVRSELQVARGVESARAVFEGALASDAVETRRWAAEALTFYERSDALRHFARDEDAQVRACVARALGKRQRYRLTWPLDTTEAEGEMRWLAPPSDAGALALLAELASDPALDVRLAVAEAATVQPDALPLPALERLARDPSPDVRSRIATLDIGDPEVMGRVKATLAADPDPAVLEKLDAWLGNRIEKLARDGAPTEHLLDALRVRLFHPTRTLLVSDRGRAARVVASAAVGPRATPEVVRWAVERSDPTLLERLAIGLDWTGADGANRGSIAFLDDALLERFLRAAFPAIAGREQIGTRNDIAASLSKSRPARAGALLPILSDRSAPRLLRAISAIGLAREDGQAFEDALIDLLVDPSWENESDQQAQEPRNLLSNVGKLLPADARERVMLRAIRERSTATPAVAALLRSAQQEPLPSIARPMLERWPAAPPEIWPTIHTALRHLDPATPADRDVVLRALDSTLAGAAISAMARRPDPAFLAPLGAIVRGPGETDEERAHKKDAARALANYLDDAAAEHLLAGAASTHEDVRTACFDALETIRRYQDEKGRWLSRKGGEAARLAAVEELVPLLADRDPVIRAQAARSLGTLGAVEHLPKLVALLKDPSADVRKAAEEALERLHAQKP